MERACLQLFEIDENGQIIEAILDVVMHFPGGPQQRMLDATIRCPHAQTYRDLQPGSVPGVAAASGIKDKLDRYGSSVLCLAFETYGRLASASVNHLRDLALDFSCNSRRQGPGQAYHFLRLSLERALLFEVADITPEQVIAQVRKQLHLPE